MIIRLTVLFTSLIWATAGLARDVLVRTGEHDVFTRIVADLPPGTKWDLRVDRSELMLTTRSEIRFRTSGVYTRISRQRIDTIEGTRGGNLGISLRCECRVESFQQPNGWVIIDVFNPSEAALPKDQKNPSTVFAALPDSLALPRPPAILPGSLARAIDAAPDAPMRRAIVDQARNAIVEQFARGAAQGLIDADQVPTSKASAPEPANPDTIMVDPVLLGNVAYPNMRVETQIDRDSPSRATADVHTGCLPAETFDFAAWGDETSPLRRIVSLHSELYDEAGQGDPLVHGNLVRAYLFAGFTDEARATLRAAPAGLDQYDELLVITQALQDLSGHPALNSQIDCDTNGSVLAFLSDDGPTMADPAKLIQRLAAMPTPLRDMLGPRIAERFLNLGMRDEASVIRNGFVRAGRDSSPETSFVVARLAEAGTNRAEAPLSRVIEDRTPRAAEAMIFLIGSQMSRGQAPDLDLIEQAMALSFETSDPSRADLESAILGALTARDDFTRAIAEIDRLRLEGRGPFEEIETELFSKVAQIPDDATFLRVMVPLSDRKITDADTRVIIAERLIAQSLSSQAETVIDASGDIPTRRERLLRARIAADDGKPKIARSYLAGLDGPEVQEIETRLIRETSAPPLSVSPPTEREDVARANPDMRIASETLDRSAALRQELDALLSE